MPALANEEVPVFEVGQIHAEKEMQNRIKNPAGVMRRQHRRGFDGDDDEPKNRRDPCLEKMLPLRVQTRALLDGIVGSLAGDHDIMHVAFAQSCAADAHEASLLQQFADGRAAAVAHAGF